jgi:carboxyl-terminal processing protease
MSRAARVAVAACSFACGMIVVASAQSSHGAATPKFAALRLFEAVAAVVDERYPVKIDEQAMVAAGLNRMLTALDPHSSYIPAAEYQGLLSGGQASIGVTLIDDRNGLRILDPIGGSPAARAGLQLDDWLVAIDGQSPGHAAEAVRLLRGPKGSTVTLNVRGADGNYREIRVERGIVEPGPAVIFENLDGVAYLKFAALSGYSATAARAALARSIGDSKPRGLVLDLRDNSGGLLDSTVEVADLFMEAGPIAYELGRSGRNRTDFVARRGDVIQGAPIVVLINHGTAAGAEIIAGSLRDRRGAKLIGVRSNGAGTIQSVIPLRGGRDGALRLTTHRIFLPSAFSFDKVGLKPDETIIDGTRPRPKPGERQKAAGPGESTIAPVTIDVSTDPSLARALSLLRTP